MVLEEKTSKQLGVPYVYLPKCKQFLCANGVPFTLEEYKKGINVKEEYARREKEGTLYDYSYAKSTGLLRKKRNFGKENTSATKENIEEKETGNKKETDKTVTFICLLLLFTAVISGYISTLHTATYLYAYVDIFASWLMSSSVTAYNAAALEVSVIFKNKNRYFLSLVFITLWAMVTLFSMITTVSVFYDRFNFIELAIAEENKEIDSGKLALELLQKKEKDIREAIAFKKQDIEYRQEKEFATAEVRKELVLLENELRANLTEQQNLLEKKPEVTGKVIKRKESLFSFLGRLINIEGSVLEFIMSTLSAIFINIICPFSLTAVAELRVKQLDKL